MVVKASGGSFDLRDVVRVRANAHAMYVVLTNGEHVTITREQWRWLRALMEGMRWQS